MINDAMAGKIDLIVTKSVSRFARNTVDTLNVIRQLKSIGVEVYFEKENIYTLDTKGEFLITLMSSLAEEEARSLSENVKWGKRKAFSDGRYTLPYKHFLGYKKGTDNLPEIVPTEAQIVRWIYYLYLIGTAPSTISKMLTQAGIYSPGNKKRWSPTTIISILQNEKYYGAALLQKEFTVDYRTKKTQVNRGELPQYYIEYDHDPIIPKVIFDEVQECRRSRKRAGESHTLFANQIYCSECGGAYGPRIWHSTTQNSLRGRRNGWQVSQIVVFTSVRDGFEVFRISTVGDADTSDLSLLCHIYCLLFFYNGIIGKLIAGNPAAFFYKSDDPLCVGVRLRNLIQGLFCKLFS